MPSSSSSLSSGSSSCLCISPVVYCNLLAGFTSDYDPSGNKLYDRHLHAECRSFLYPSGEYDSADRLLSFQRGLLQGGGQSVGQTLPTPGLDTQRTYNLDAAGNWVSDGDGATPAVSFTHDCGVQDTQDRTTNSWNQVASESDSGVAVTPITYDAKGNLTAYGDMIFEFDAFNRMISASGTGPDGQPFSASYAYDALGRRIQKVVNDTETDFYFDGQQVVEEQDETGKALRQYVWGRYVDELVQQREYQQPPFGGPYGDLYPLSDLLYRSWALTHDRECGTGSSSGGPGGGGGAGGASSSSGPATPFVEVYDTDAYGRTRVYNAPGPDGQWFTDDDQRTFVPLCRYIYTGREYDAETGLYYYRARYYHPDLGRFVSRDPLLFDGGDANLYRYGLGNPLVGTDPEGEFVFLIPLAIIAAGALIGAAHGIADVYSANPNAGLGQYALGGALGGIFGGLNPIGELVSAGGAIVGGTIEKSGGGDFFGVGFQAGGLAGILAGGFGAAARQATLKVSEETALHTAIWFGAKAGARAVGVEGLGAGLGYYETGSMRGALQGAQLGVFGGGIVRAGAAIFRRGGLLAQAIGERKRWATWKDVEMVDPEEIRGKYGRTNVFTGKTRIARGLSPVDYGETALHELYHSYTVPRNLLLSAASQYVRESNYTNVVLEEFGAELHGTGSISRARLHAWRDLKAGWWTPR